MERTTIHDDMIGRIPRAKRHDMMNLFLSHGYPLENVGPQQMKMYHDYMTQADKTFYDMAVIPILFSRKIQDAHPHMDVARILLPYLFHVKMSETKSPRIWAARYLSLSKKDKRKEEYIHLYQFTKKQLLNKTRP